MTAHEYMDLWMSSRAIIVLVRDLIVLVLVLVLDFEGVCHEQAPFPAIVRSPDHRSSLSSRSVSLPDAEFIRIKPLDQPRQHCDHASQDLLACVNTIVCGNPLCDGSIKTSCAFQSGTASIIEELCPLTALSFSITLRSIEQSRHASPVELVNELAPTPWFSERPASSTSTIGEGSRLTLAA